MHGNGKEKGTVKWFNGKKGYGFIARDSGAPDVFVHFSEIQQSNGNGRRNLKEGQKVEFQVEKSDKGFKAVQVAVRKES